MENIDIEEINEMTNIIQKNTPMMDVLDGMNVIVVLLNEQRRIVFYNKMLATLLGHDYQSATGERVGDLLYCKFADEALGGCGNTPSCVDCNSNGLVLKAINTKDVVEGDSTIIQIFNDLEVTHHFKQKVTPIEIEGYDYYMVALIDRSIEVAKDNIQRIFFHDVMNTASGLYNVIRLLKFEKTYEDNKDMKLIEDYIKDIIEEIRYQKDILNVEKGTKTQNDETFELNSLVISCIKLLHRNNLFDLIDIEFNPFEDISLNTNRTVLRRILVNIIKNALEANETGEVVKVEIKMYPSFLTISVLNAEVIPAEIKNRMFSKGFSTKGDGRGLGIYGAKLLANDILNGELTFESDEESGTVFKLKLPIKNYNSTNSKKVT